MNSLVERLRSHDATAIYNSSDEAAALIEQQAARIAELETAYESACTRATLWHENYQELRQRIDDAPGVAVTPDDVHWIVNSLGELGVEIHGRFFFLYKGESLEYCDDRGDDEITMQYRMVGKREFGETCHPITCMTVENGQIYDRTPYPYTQTLLYTPGLSFGKEGDADWKPLPLINKEDLQE